MWSRAHTRSRQGLSRASRQGIQFSVEASRIEVDRLRLRALSISTAAARLCPHSQHHPEFPSLIINTNSIISPSFGSSLHRQCPQLTPPLARSSSNGRYSRNARSRRAPQKATQPTSTHTTCMPLIKFITTTVIYQSSHRFFHLFGISYGC